MADIVLKDRNGKDVTYEGIETVTFDTPTEGEQVVFTEGVKVEGIEIGLDMSNGDQNITAPDGILVKSAIIKKPETMTPENIRSGVEIGGVVGDFIGDTEETTVELSMADGDQVIEPSDVGKVLSKVTVKKPETLVPENIAEGIDIAGVIGEMTKGSNVKAITKFLKLPSFGITNSTVELISANEFEEAGIDFPSGAYYFALMFVPTRLYESGMTVSNYYIAMCFISNNVLAYASQGAPTGNFYGFLETHMMNSSGSHYRTGTDLQSNYFSKSNTNGLFYADGALKCAVNASTYLKQTYVVVAGYVTKP